MTPEMKKLAEAMGMSPAQIRERERINRESCEAADELLKYAQEIMGLDSEVAMWAFSRAIAKAIALEAKDLPNFAFTLLNELLAQTQKEAAKIEREALQGSIR